MRQKTFGFLKFSGGAEMEHWPKMGSCTLKSPGNLMIIGGTELILSRCQPGEKICLKRYV